MKIFGNLQGGGRKFLGHFKYHFGSQISFRSLKRLYILWMNPKFATKVSFITVCKRWVASNPSVVLPTSALTKPARCVTRKLDLDQTSVAHKHAKDTKLMWLKLTFQSGRMTFTPISNKLCIIYCYYVCFGLLMPISLADYSAYLHELQVSCTLWSLIRSISGWFLNFKSIFSNCLPPLNLNKFSGYCFN